MFVMRRTAAGDEEAVVTMTRARADWLEARGLEGEGWREFAPEYGRQAEDTDFPVWALEYRAWSAITARFRAGRSCGRDSGAGSRWSG